MANNSQPRAIILHANGINRDHDAAAALTLAGANPDIVPINRLRSGECRWEDYQLLCIPGGFSYADALGGGRLMALDLNHYFTDQVNEFVESGKPVIGICNGFQALVKAGILPGPLAAPVKKPKAAKKSAVKAKPAKSANVEKPLRATLTFNEDGKFECRWVYLSAVSEKSLWTSGLDELIYCPVAHGEGRFLLEDPKSLDALRAAHQVALVYAYDDGSEAEGIYPENPNGSPGDVAGVCNARGNVLGLMPHPEDHIYDWQHPRFARGETGHCGLALFENGVRYAAEM